MAVRILRDALYDLQHLGPGLADVLDLIVRQLGQLVYINPQVRSSFVILEV